MTTLKLETKDIIIIDQQTPAPQGTKSAEDIKSELTKLGMTAVIAPASVDVQLMHRNDKKLVVVSQTMAGKRQTANAKKVYDDLSALGVATIIAPAGIDLTLLALDS